MIFLRRFNKALIILVIAFLSVVIARYLQPEGFWIRNLLVLIFAMTFETISQVVIKRVAFQDVVASAVFGSDAYEEALRKKATTEDDDPN